jgi:RNA polymerase sigma factor (sigma-70 family)
LVGRLSESSLNVVIPYVRGIARRRRLRREQSKDFIIKTRGLLRTAAEREPGFIIKLAADLVTRTPTSSSPERGAFSEMIRSVLEDLGIFHSRMRELVGLPSGWDVAVPDEQTPEWLAEFAESSRRLKEALASVDKDAAQILNAYYYEGLSLSQIGDRIGKRKQRVSEIRSAALVTLIRALRCLRQEV